MKIYTIYDSKSETYSYPYQARATGEALRIFTTIANDDQHPIGKYPADYTLFQIGEFDDQKADYKILDAKINLGNALEFVNKEFINEKEVKDFNNK